MANQLFPPTETTKEITVKRYDVVENYLSRDNSIIILQSLVIIIIGLVLFLKLFKNLVTPKKNIDELTVKRIAVEDTLSDLVTKETMLDREITLLETQMEYLRKRTLGK